MFARRSAELLSFLRAGRAGGFVLIMSGVVAVIWANSELGPTYFSLLTVRIGSHSIPFWINDALMAVFFLRVGLELRREMNQGELRSPGRLAAPAIAALGGMVAPAVVFSLFNYHDRIAMRGWAVPVATDIAFALAVLSVLGRRVPIGLKVFLAALAIIDDLGAIIVIALFYSDHLHFGALAGAVTLIAALWGCSRAGIENAIIYLIGAVLLWYLVFRSGIHATLSGVAIAFVVPARCRDAEFSSLATRLEHALNPYVAYMILPLFGLANSGLHLGALPAGVLTAPLFLGAALALTIGKPIGVFGAILIAFRFRLATAPAQVSRLQLLGAAMICGIGFTMSLFIGDLAFGDSVGEDEVKLAVFVASLTSAALGLAVLAATPKRPSRP